MCQVKCIVVLPCPFIPESPDSGAGKPVSNQHLLQWEEEVKPIPKVKITSCSDTKLKTGAPKANPIDAPRNPSTFPTEQQLWSLTG